MPPASRSGHCNFIVKPVKENTLFIHRDLIKQSTYAHLFQPYCLTACALRGVPQP